MTSLRIVYHTKRSNSSVYINIKIFIKFRIKPLLKLTKNGASFVLKCEF